MNHRESLKTIQETKKGRLTRSLDTNVTQKAGIRSFMKNPAEGPRLTTPPAPAVIVPTSGPITLFNDKPVSGTCDRGTSTSTDLSAPSPAGASPQCVCRCTCAAAHSPSNDLLAGTPPGENQTNHNRSKPSDAHEGISPVKIKPNDDSSAKNAQKEVCKVKNPPEEKPVTNGVKETPPSDDEKREKLADNTKISTDSVEGETSESTPDVCTDNEDDESYRLMISESIPEDYWADLAETRRIALSETLDENEELHRSFNELKEENRRLSEAMEQAEKLAQFFQEYMKQ